ncbi:hypothetical protein ABK040_005830 [Willaertia magna]
MSTCYSSRSTLSSSRLFSVIGKNNNQQGMKHKLNLSSFISVIVFAIVLLPIFVNSDSNDSNNETATTANYTWIDAVLDIGMIFGPQIGYVAQYREIVQLGSSKGFAKLTCLILLVSNTLRIFFWYLKQFSSIMLFQSIVMIIGQLLILHIAVYFNDKNDKEGLPTNIFNINEDDEENGLLVNRKKKKQNEIDEMSMNNTMHILNDQQISILKYSTMDKNVFLDNFWQWDDFTYYLWSLLFFNLFILIITLFFYPIFPNFYTELIGMTSLSVEAMLAVPQVIKNYRNGSTQGLSLILVLTFVFGDTIKTAYFMVRKLPFQFIFSGCFQIVVDFVLVSQMVYYDYWKFNTPLVNNESIKIDNNNSSLEGSNNGQDRYEVVSKDNESDVEMEELVTENK